MDVKGMNTNDDNDEANDDNHCFSSEEDNEYDFSNILFTKNLAPLSFYLLPCDERTKIRSLIERGGGVFESYDASLNSPSVFLLLGHSWIKMNVSPEEMKTSRYYSVQFVFDCCKTNTLLDIEKYKVVPKAHLMPPFDNLTTQSRKVYSAIEDMQLINFVVENRRFSEIKGLKLYEDMVKAKICPNRTFWSLRTHFLNSIMPLIDCFPLSEDSKNLLNFYFKKENTKERKAAIGKKVESSELSESCEIDVNAEKQNIGISSNNTSQFVSTVCSYDKCVESQENSAKLKRKRKKKYCINNLLSEESEEEAQESDETFYIEKKHKEHVHSRDLASYRRSYSRDEDNKLLKWLYNRKYLDQTRGNQIWMTAEKEKVLNRTWQSMRERYLKRLLPNLYLYDLTYEEATTFVEFSGFTSKKRKQLLEQCLILKKKRAVLEK
ncbi:telomeric repeat-binding factor 2-interacting protein 1-like isoform X1 [Dinothrombium tinctorium]|uniref:Telomeric repeat-binding factor 2-interacting protein 1 n=1 Tax=Dinothrombium tinctorium TaxID=1965070 RepID=A0A443QZR7_9ACAR|nr:telomeric repeat-binding factor 2-interacting protein 1-like isoform X1 [Dinothrombium tinctorium]